MHIELNLIKKVIINIEGQYSSSNDNSIWWGFPIFENSTIPPLPEKYNIYNYNKVSGYFCHVFFNENSFLITSDIVGNYRIYYYENDDLIYFTDNYLNIINNLHSNNNFFIDYNQLEFWRNHRYTFGDRTFVKQIKKIPPHTTIHIDKQSINRTSYFDTALENKKNHKKHIEVVKNTILNTFSNLKYIKDPIILLFSGGSDSLYLANRLKELNIDFVPVFFRMFPEIEFTYNEWIKAKKGAEEISAPLLTIDIDILSKKEKVLPKIIDEMLFDRHFSMIHYIGFNELAKKFPANSIIINGQGSDSIFSFGPSPRTIGALFQRILLYYPYPINWILKKALEYKVKKKFYFPKNLIEKLRAFCDERGYVFLLSQNELAYNNDIDDYIVSITSDITDLSAKRMIIKLNTFLQGSDNQVCIKSARHFGFNNIILPFCFPDIIYGTIRYKDIFKELLSPKYVVRNKTIQSYREQKNIDEEQKKNFISISIYALEDDVNSFFYEKIDEIMK